MANWLARRVDAVIAVSRYSAEQFARWSKVPIERAFVLPNCVDLDTFQPQPRDPALLERYGLKAHKVILTVGRLASAERHKGFDEVIELMPRLLKRFPDLKYLIVGEGDDRPRLEAKADSYRVANHVIFTGQIPESEKVAHYNLADAFVMPSTWEGFGIVLIEAAACGVPVIGSRADGSREALRDGLLGRLVDPRKPEELIEAVTAVLKNPSPRARADGIDMFSTQNFRARVADWCRAQAAYAAGVMTGRRTYPARKLGCNETGGALYWTRQRPDAILRRPPEFPRSVFGNFNRPKWWHPMGQGHRVLHNMNGVRESRREVSAAVCSTIAEKVERVSNPVRMLFLKFACCAQSDARGTCDVRLILTTE